MNLMLLAAALLLTALPARAEDVCLTNLGRIRVRPACRPAPYERPFAFSRQPRVVDRNGELVGQLSPYSGAQSGPLFVLRTLADGTVVEFTMTTSGPLSFGDAAWFAEPNCHGDLRVSPYSFNMLVEIGPVVDGTIYVPVGPVRTGQAQSELRQLYPGDDCTTDGGTPSGTACCFSYAPFTLEYRSAQLVRLADAGLEPPFRLSLE